MLVNFSACLIKVETLKKMSRGMGGGVKFIHSSRPRRYVKSNNLTLQHNNPTILELRENASAS